MPSVPLIIPDLHEPATHRKALRHALKIAEKYDVTETVFLGDMVDHHCISFHDKFPEMYSALAEYKMMRRRLLQWKKYFPNAKVCIGNHDERVHRLVRKIGIPGSVYLRTYNDTFFSGTPYEGDDGWKWDYSHRIGEILFTHGVGMTSAARMAPARNCSVVSGHLHTKCEITWFATDAKRFFGMNVGCLVDRHHPAMEYAKADIKKPLLAVAVIKDGTPILEMLDI